MNPGWLEAQLVPLLHRSLSQNEQRVIQAEFSHHRRDLWEDLGQLLFVEILSHPKETDDIRRAIWRVSKRLSRETLKSRSQLLDSDLIQPVATTEPVETRLQIEEFLSRLSDHDRALVQMLLDGTPEDIQMTPEQRKRLCSSFRKIRAICQ